MELQANTLNVYDHIIEHGLTAEITSFLSLTDCGGTNASTRIDFGNGTYWFYKQAQVDFRTGAFSMRVDREGWFYERVYRRASIKHLRTFIPYFIHYSRKNHALILRYLEEWETLSAYYRRIGRYPTTIASSIADLLASVHQNSFAHPEKYKDFCDAAERRPTQFVEAIPTPEAVAEFPQFGLKLISLLQRHPRLVVALAELKAKWQPMCLIHNDVKSDNFLKPVRRVRQKQVSLILLDWEFWDWGDPAWDIGAALGDYLWIWLGSLNIVKGQSVKEWFTTAKIPFERVKKAMHTLWARYVKLCRAIVYQRCEMPKLVVQHAGMFLLSRVMMTLMDGSDLTVRNLCIMQVAKNLLEHPEEQARLVLG